MLTVFGFFGSCGLDLRKPIQTRHAPVLAYRRMTEQERAASGTKIRRLGDRLFPAHCNHGFVFRTTFKS